MERGLKGWAASLEKEGREETARPELAQSGLSTVRSLRSPWHGRRVGDTREVVLSGPARPAGTGLAMEQKPPWM